MKETELIDEYISRHIEGEHPYLYKLYRDSNLYLVHGHMISGHVQGTFLHMMVKLLTPKRILEIGTYTGYSCLSMASALSEGGKILTYEINDEMEDFTRPRINASPWADKVDFRIGNVLTDLPQDAGPFELVLSVLVSGGLIIADNTLWDGHVIDVAYDRDAQTKGIRAFNDLVAQDDRVEKAILPLRDGLTLIRKK